MDDDRLVKLVIPKSDFESLKNDVEFQAILVLGRHMNQLAFIYSSVKKAGVEHVELRDGFNAIVFAASALCEGMKSIKLGGLFHNYEGVEEFWNKSDVKRVWDYSNKNPQTLHSIRKKLAYHIDKDVIKKVVRKKRDKFKIDELVLFRTAGPFGTNYAELSDLIIADYFFDEPLTKKERMNNAQKMAALKEFLGVITEITLLYIRTVGNIMAEYCDKKGWTLVYEE